MVAGFRDDGRGRYGSPRHRRRAYDLGLDLGLDLDVGRRGRAAADDAVNVTVNADEGLGYPGVATEHSAADGNERACSARPAT